MYRGEPSEPCEWPDPRLQDSAEKRLQEEDLDRRNHDREENPRGDSRQLGLADLWTKLNLES